MENNKLAILMLSGSLMIVLGCYFYFHKTKEGEYFNYSVNSITYSEITRLDQGIKSYKGREIKWRGKIASKYSQIDGIKFCIIDDSHKNPDIYSECDWFWAIPKELATEKDSSYQSDWNGNLVELMFKNYSNIDYDKINSEKDEFIITGKLDSLDTEVDYFNRVIPSIEVTKIEKVE